MSRTDVAELISQKIIELKKLLPKGFAQICVDRLKEKDIKVTKNAVYQVTSLKSQNADIINELALIVIEKNQPILDILDKALNKKD
jgi:hypothetical protein